MGKKLKFYELARVIRSKNAGPFKLTLDIFFDNVHIYQAIKQSKLLNKSLIARLYKTSKSMVEGIYFVDTALGIKITLQKPVASDDINTTDVYGAQQHAPLLELEIDEDWLK